MNPDRTSGGRRVALRAGLAAALLSGIAALTGACVTLHAGDLYPDGADQVHVPWFSNDTFYKDVEFELTEAVVAEILSSPGLKLSSRETAEVLLSGRVLDVRQRVLSEDPSQSPTSTNTSVTVEVKLIDARTGSILKQRRLTGRGFFAPQSNEDLAFAQREAFRYLARDIVRLFEEDF